MRASACPIFALLLALAGCMFSPTNDTRLSATSASVRVSGFTPGIDADIRVLASRSRSGPWTQVDRIVGSSSPISVTGGTVYEFRKNVVIPSGLWSADGCDRVTYLKSVVSPSFNLYSFDRVAPDGQDPELCVLTVANATGNLAQAAQDCASPQSPVVRLTAPGPRAFHTGSITLRRPTDAEPYECLEVLTGDLIVREDPSADFLRPLPPIRLPRLREVRGTMDLVYQQPFRPGGSEARRIELPALTRVTEDVRLDNPRSEATSSLSRVQMGMPRLGRIDGNLQITSNITGSSWQGMDNLGSLSGNVTVDLGGDWFVLGLGALRTIRGDLSMTLSSNGSGFTALQTIGGDLSQTGGRHFNAASFASLTRVDGDVRLTAARASGPSGIYPALATIGGRLVIDDSVVTSTGELEVGATAGLTVQRGITVRNTTATSVGLRNVRLQGSDTAEFRANTALCNSVIHRWLDGQASWSGARTLVGNAGC